MKLIINTDRSVIPVGTWGTVNENDYEILDFEFPAELEHFNKRIVYYLGDEKVWDTIVNNKAYITNAITTKGDVKAYVWCTKENTEREADTDFRTMLFDMHFYENENADGIVPTEVQVDGFNTMLTAMNAKIDEVDALETTIGAAEAQRQENENARISNESTRQSNESTRESNEQTRQSQEADRERRTDEAISQITDMTEAYNQNAQEKIADFDTYVDTAEQSILGAGNYQVNRVNTAGNTNRTAIQQAAGTALNSIVQAGETGVSAVETASSEAITNFNTNATNKTNAFNSNATEKTTTFDNNATEKTSEFNTNAESKASAFNDNATQKTTNFDNNATEKTNEFNTNAQEKIDEYDEHIVEYQAQIDELQEEVDELSENMPWNTTEQATEISVDDAAKYSKNKLELFGNTEQNFILPLLPTGYTAIEYIESTSYLHNSNYIDTNIYPNNNTKIEIDLMIREKNGHSFDRIFGATHDIFSSYCTMFVDADCRLLNKYNNKDQTGLILLKYATRYKFIRDKNKMYINNELKAEVQESEFQDENPLRLFSSFTGDRDGKFVLYLCKIWDNDTLVRDFVPCKNDNNEIGLYDLVSQTFFATQGTGNFVAGDEIKPIHVVTGNNTISIGSTNYSINLGSLELCKIGNYQDYLYKENGNWYESKRINKYKLTSGFIDTGGIRNEVYRILTRQSSAVITPALNEKDTILTACTHFASITRNQSDNGNITTINSIAMLNTSGFMISLPKGSDLSSVSAFKTFVDNNDIIIYYILATPIITQITDETLIAQLDEIYEHLKLVKGTNNITVTAADLAPLMKLSYMQDLPSKLDKLDSRLSLLE